jgi:hypothetical protein
MQFELKLCCVCTFAAYTDAELGNGHSGIGVCLALQGKASEAVEHFEAAKSARRFDPPSSGTCTVCAH